MLVAAAVCPHPPLIVPELAGAASFELDDLRAACDSAIRSLAEARPDLLVVVGGAERSARHPADASGTMRPWGADVRVGAGEPVLPLSLTIGRWLVERTLAGVLPDLRFEAIAADASPGDCVALGREIARSADRVALLAMGDGSARLTEKSPGYLHPLAAPYNRMLGDAMASAEAGRLLEIDPAVAEELWVGGRAAFQVLAGAAEPVEGARRATRRLGGSLYDDAPYGVGYFVARWLVEESKP
ncbi:class III extradiol dioxygenase subunit B-like domain-containing protein [Planotetraspora sp. A-T 1434]|uniref:class III extradiol dioxygenase subunit B-like domain-containing protein n=1 Tax=Planotetraspora sp. A-T 1434 TaxID=2979219 RepID=UPI0021C078AA|nr:class III extradiol dioxygenase subunit B-like domain-containing protein [Planotetraspora sp. A-T 1434]MCT9932923.1 class III extradiol dioxygenase subunit B-like domain-containing protein [Planotetraspora sp. A-T 1434]